MADVGVFVLREVELNVAKERCVEASVEGIAAEVGVIAEVVVSCLKTFVLELLSR